MRSVFNFTHLECYFDTVIEVIAERCSLTIRREDATGHDAIGTSSLMLMDEKGVVCANFTLNAITDYAYIWRNVYIDGRFSDDGRKSA